MRRSSMAVHRIGPRPLLESMVWELRFRSNCNVVGGAESGRMYDVSIGRRSHRSKGKRRNGLGLGSQGGVMKCASGDRLKEACAHLDVPLYRNYESQSLGADPVRGGVFPAPPVAEREGSSRGRGGGRAQCCPLQ